MTQDWWKEKKLIKTKLKRVYDEDDEDDEDYSDIEGEKEEQKNYTSEEERMINLFKKTYDAKHIQTLPNDKKNILKPNLNPVLNRLLNNLTSAPLPPHRFIEGPTIFFKYTLPSSNKTFYLFGDNGLEYLPRPREQYLTIYDYLSHLSINTDSFFDFYLESEPTYYTVNHNFLFLFTYIYRKNHNTLKTNETASSFEFTYQNLYSSCNIPPSVIGNTGMLSTILNYLNNQKIQVQEGLNSTLFFLSKSPCFDKTNRSIVACQLSRSHNIDISSLENRLDPFYLLYIVFYYDKHPRYSFKLTIEEKIALYKNSGLTCNLRKLFFDYKKSIFSYIIKNIKNAYEQSYYQSEIKNFVFSKINILVRRFLPRNSILKLIQFFETDNQAIDRDILTLIKNLEFFFYNIQYMKKIIYGLSRIFKLYYVTEDYQPVETYNIILYVKKNMLRFYREFLDSIGGQILFNSENTQNLSYTEFPYGI